MDKRAIGLMAVIGLAIGVAAWLVLTGGSRACHETPRRVMCASNLAQIGRALSLYAQENGDTYPPTPSLLLMTQDLVPEVFVCPVSDVERAPTREAFVGTFADSSYLYLAGGLTDVSKLGDDVVLLIDRPENHDGDGGNVLFADGHVEFIFWKRPTTRPSDATPDPAWVAVQDQIDRNVRPVRWPRPATRPTW